jgi:ADP-heptose:LPS heptosyltransferase
MNIAIKLPDSLKDKVQTYPALHALIKHYKKMIEDKNAEIKDEVEHETLNIHLLSTKESIEVLNLLPFMAYYHELEDEDVKTVFSIHRGIVNSKLESADIFISMTESFVDASIGKNLKASQRVGFALGKNKFFFTDKVSLLKGRKKSEQYFELLRPLIEKFPEKISNVCSKEMQPYYEDWSENPYVIVSLPVAGNEIQPLFTELFDLCEGVNFVLMAHDLEDDIYKESMEKYIKTLNFKNTYKIFDSKSIIDFAKAIYNCWTYITMDSDLFQVAAYCGANIHHLYSDNHYQNYGSDYFYAETRQFNLKEDQYKGADGIQYNLIFDEIISYIHKKQSELKEQEK